MENGSRKLWEVEDEAEWQKRKTHRMIAGGDGVAALGSEIGGGRQGTLASYVL